MFSKRLVFKLMSIFFSCIFLMACTSNLTQNPPEGAIPEGAIPIEQVASSDTSVAYSIYPGDQLDIKFYYNNDLNEQTVVRPDGKISLRLIGDVAVIGKTPSELRQILIDKYSKHLLDPEIVVLVQSFGSMTVYVGGEVNIPGMVNINGRTTIVQAVFGAGGFKSTAQKKQVVLLRNAEGGKPIFSIVDINDILESPNSKKNAVLKSHDVIYVPKTSIAVANQFVDEYFKQLIPISYNIGFSWLKYLGGPDN